MINNLTVVEHDLKQIQAELKKKHTSIRDKVTQVLNKYSEYKNGANKDDKNQFPTEDILSAVVSIPTLKLEKSQLKAIDLFKNMLNYGFLKEDDKITVINYLGKLISIQDDSIQLKVLQTMLLFITEEHLDFNSFELIERLLSLSLLMYNSKNPLIHNMTSSAVNQITSQIFDNLIEYIKVAKLQQKPEKQNKELTNFFYQKSMKLIKDFIMIIAGNRPSWAPQNINVPTNYGFDLVNSIIKQIGPYLAHSKDAHQTLKQDLFPLISAAFDKKSHDFMGFIRIMRAFSRCVLHLHDGLEMIGHLLQFMDNKLGYGEQFLILEGIKACFADKEILKMLNKRLVSTNSYFTELILKIQAWAKELCHDPQLNPQNMTSLSFKMQKILDSDSNDQEQMVINSCHVYKSISECLSTFAETSIFLSEEYEIKLGYLNKNLETDDQKDFYDILHNNWKNVLKILKYLLPKEVDESVTQTILNTLQNLINLTGSLYIPQGRDSIIMTLCNGCLPNGGENIAVIHELNLRHIQAAKKLFNIAYCLGEILDVNSWHLIFATLQKTEIIFLKIRQEIQGSPVKKKAGGQQSEQEKVAIKNLVNQEDENSIMMDLQILFSALDTLFIQTNNYTTSHFLAFINALNRVSLDYLEKMMTSDNLASEGLMMDGKVKIFGLTRMVDTILANLPRIEIFWDIVLDHYVCMSNSKVSLLRQMGIENLNTVIEKVLEYKLSKYSNIDLKKYKSEPVQEPIEEGKIGATSLVYTKSEGQNDEKLVAKWSEDTYQQTLFKPWLEISKQKFNDVKESICTALLKLMQNNGHTFQKVGWQTIAQILFEVSSEPGKAANIGFNCLDMIFTDFLHEIEMKTIETLIDVIENVKKVSTDNNLSYQSVEMFWKVGDHLAIFLNENQEKRFDSGFEQIWLTIHNKLMVITQDEHPELRHSAIHTLTSLIVHHGNLLGNDKLNSILDEIFIKMLDQITETYILVNRNEQKTEGPTDTPKFNAKGQNGNSPPKPKTSTFSDATNQSNSKSNDDKNKNLKSWIDTMIILLQNMLKIARKFINLIEKHKDIEQDPKSVKILKTILHKLKSIMLISRFDLIAESIKAFHDLILSNPKVLTLCIDTIFDVIVSSKSFLTEVRQESKEVKAVITKFIPEVLDILLDIFEPERYNSLNPENKPFAKIAFEVVDKCIYYSKATEAFNMISPHRVLTDMRQIYQFIEKVPSQLSKGNQDMTDQYFNYILGVIGAPITDKFQDVLVRKFLGILQRNICENVFHEEVYFDHMSELLSKINYVMNLRTDNEFLTLMINTSKDQLPIWLFATDHFLSIITHILGDFLREYHNNKSDQNKELALKTAEYQSKFLNKVLAIYDEVLRNSAKSLESISKGLLSEIKRDWFEMDMKFINSISDVIFPNFELLDQETLWKLMQILDNAYTFYSKSPLFSEQGGSYGRDPATNSTISKITLEILFKISEDKTSFDISDDESDKTSQKKSSLSKLATKRLILKCKKTIERYLYDDERSGSMPLPRSRILEICHILDKLKKLNIPKNSFVFDPNASEEDEANSHDNSLQDLNYIQNEHENIDNITLIKVKSEKIQNNPLLQGKKGHLVYLMPALARCITCRDSELKNLLKDIFTEISKELGIDF